MKKLTYAIARIPRSRIALTSVKKTKTKLLETTIVGLWNGSIAKSDDRFCSQLRSFVPKVMVLCAHLICPATDTTFAVNKLKEATLLPVML